MPTKHPVKERAWGSRYDTLQSSPSSPSNPTTPVVPPANSHSSISNQTVEAVSDDDKLLDAPQPMADTAAKPDRPINNDNSIFVGSLPTHIEPVELTHMLSQHFADYPQVKDVKAIRDVVKASVCAFIACEDAAAASELLTTLRSTPQKPFMGRLLRFEFARASRALVISYRAPTYLSYPNSGLDSPQGSEDPRLNGHTELPSAMRIFRPINSKHAAVLYDTDAINFDAATVSSTTPLTNMNTPTPNDALRGAGVLIQPLKYDSGTLQKIASAFGPIESFGPFIANKDGGETADTHRPPKLFANIVRSPGMEDGAWEIKWQHRDDCVSASMTLRRIPHLVVNWAHHLSSDVAGGSRFASPSTSPGPLQWSASRTRHLSRAHMNDNEYQRLQDHHFSPVFSPSDSLRLMGSPYSEGRISPNLKHWSSTYDSPNTRAPSSPLAMRNIANEPSLDTTVVQGNSEVDFPPLHGHHRIRKNVEPLSLRLQLNTCITRDDDTRTVRREPTLSPSPSSSLSVQPSTPGTVRSTPSPAAKEENAVASRPSLSTAIEDNASETGRAQELAVPLTPEFTTASVTPVTPKTSHSFPPTPQSIRKMDFYGTTSENYHMTPRRVGRFGSGNVSREEFDTTRAIDPLSVFVGNLEVGLPQGWTEERLRGVFEKYGPLEDVKLHEPVHKNVGFAFIKYADIESSARAVAAEHEKVYNGRIIRVQLRELKPFAQRTTPFKVVRGRGRPRMYGDSPRHVPSSAGVNFTGDHTHDGFVSNGRYSPGSMHGRAANLQDMRQNCARDPPPHLSLRHSTTDSTHHAQPGQSNEHRASSAFEHSYPSWRAPTYQPESAERSANTSTVTSASISPPPSSTGSHPSSAMSHISPYPMMVPWIHPYHAYPYVMPYMPPYMAYPPHIMQPYSQAMPDANGANTDIYRAQQQAWASQGFKRPAAYPSSATPAEQNQHSTCPTVEANSEVQPPLRAVAFEHTSTGMFVPMYPPEALSQYMSAQSQGYRSDQTPPPQDPHQQQQPTSAYPPYQSVTQMPMYPYPYGSQMSIAPSFSQATMHTSQFQPQQSQGLATNNWAQVPTSATPPASQNHLQPTPPPYVVQPLSATAPLAESASFSGHYSGTGTSQTNQHYGNRPNIPPRRGMNRAHSFNNARHPNAHASPSRFQRHASPHGHLGASCSFVHAIPQPRSIESHPGTLRSYPPVFSASQSGSGV